MTADTTGSRRCKALANGRPGALQEGLQPRPHPPPGLPSVTLTRPAASARQSADNRRGTRAQEQGMIRDIIRMGDQRLLRIAQPVDNFGSAELHALVADMFETMDAARGVGLAAPQIAVDLQLMVFGFDSNARYPDAP